MKLLLMFMANKKGRIYKQKMLCLKQFLSEIISFNWSSKQNTVIERSTWKHLDIHYLTTVE